MRFEEELNNIRNENGLIDYRRLQRLIDLKEKDINGELVKEAFFRQDLGELLEKLRKSKNNPEKNKIQISLINSGLTDLKDKIDYMSKQGKEIENPNGIVSLVKNILEFNDQNQKGQGLKMLTPNKMLGT